eukprot:g19516.t1
MWMFFRLLHLCATQVHLQDNEMGFVGAVSGAAAQAVWGCLCVLFPNPAVKAYGIFVLCPGPGWASSAAAGAVAEEMFNRCLRGDVDCAETAKTWVGEKWSKLRGAGGEEAQ